MISRNLTFSQALARLEQVIAKLESADLQLEDGLKLLEEGVSLHKYCKDQLLQAQLKITKLLKEDVNGQA